MNRTHEHQAYDGSHLMNVLLVEDNPGDVYLTLKAFRDVELPVKVHVVTNGVEALAFLRQQGAYAQVPRPKLILLDLHVPKNDGCEVLQEIKGDADLKLIPVIMFTDSQAEEDILRAYKLHANAYIIKPVAPDHFLSIIQGLKSFWFEVVTLPSV